jgi:hypothetical protein
MLNICMDFLALLVTTRDFSRGVGWLKQGVCYRNRCLK